MSCTLSLGTEHEQDLPKTDVKTKTNTENEETTVTWKNIIALENN
jgi:hypothetical protein